MSDRQMTTEEYDLVQNNIGLAMRLYQIYYDRLSKRADYGVDANDLMSNAYFGLVRAAMRYRAYGEERGYSEESISSGQYFSVFARKSIIGQMLDSLRKIDHVHTLVRKDYKTLVENGLGSSEFTDSELAEASDMSLERLQKVVHLVQSRPVSLDDTVGEDDEQTLGAQLPSSSGTVESTAFEASLRRTLYDNFIGLDPLPRVVIAMKYFVDMEMPEIAEATNRSLTEVRRAHTEALLTLHEAWEERVRES